MNKRPPHPIGNHNLKLIDARISHKSILMVQCIFEGVGDNKRYYTLSRTISRHGQWADNSRVFLDQLNLYDPSGDLLSEILKNIGQEFHCLITEGKGFQRNVSKFLEFEPHINSEQHVLNAKITGDQGVSHV